MNDAVFTELPRSPGVWAQAWRRLKADRVGMLSMWIVMLFIGLIVLAQFGLVARDWQVEVGKSYAPPHIVGKAVEVEADASANAASGPNLDISDVDPLAPYYADWKQRAAGFKTVVVEKSETLMFGGDQMGRSVLDKAIKGAQVSITVGLLAALLATMIGTVMGALAGYAGGAVDDMLEWLYNVLTSIPYILLIFCLAAILKSGPLAELLGSGVWTVIIILALVGWTGIYRLVRAEYIKHRGRDYVRAAEAIGASHAARMFTHILPNISHVILVQLSLHVVSFIKAEVILSYLGVGVPLEMVSWGTMLNEAQTELVLGKWWQLTTATLFMATFVTAFALLTDALRDALDPKLR